MPTRDWDGSVAAPVATATVEITGGPADAAMFSAPSLTIAPGTRVTWVNKAQSAQMVSGEDLRFDDSGWIEPGGSFSLAFDEPGTFRYRCAPHPRMEGTVVVAG